jgi:hypothetical protein
MSASVTVVDPLPTFMDPPMLLPPEYTSAPLFPVGHGTATYHVVQDQTVDEPVMMIDEQGRLITGTRADVACTRAVPHIGSSAYMGPSTIVNCIRVAQVCH